MKKLAWFMLLMAAFNAQAATTSPNMSLSIPQVGDTNYPTSITNSFTLIDSHDHTSGKGVQIPAGGIATNAVTTAKILDGNVTLAKLAADAANLLLPVGSVIAYAGSSAPAGWLLCDGSAVSRAVTYTALFAAIGVAHGTGDGSTTFNIPDYRGRFLRGRDAAAGRDPNAGTRTAMNAGGATGDNVGSIQGDAFQGHFHSIVDPGHTHNMRTDAIAPATGAFRVFNGAQSPNLPTESALTGVTVTSPTTDGADGTPRISSESRPINANVTYIIKY